MKRIETETHISSLPPLLLLMEFNHQISKTMTSFRKMILIQILLLPEIVLIFTNCISDDFNLKNGIDTDISLGGDSLSFPLGNTKPILLSSIIKSDKSGILKTASDGSYSLLITDSTQLKLKGINHVTLSITPEIIPPIQLKYLETDTPDTGVKQENKIDYSTQFLRIKQSRHTKGIEFLNNNTLSKASGVSNDLYFNIPTQTINIDVNKFVSADVKRINKLTLKTASHIVFKISINNIPSDIQTVQFSNYTIQLPTVLKFNDPEVNRANQLILNNSFNVADGYSKTLAFEVIDFNSEGGIALTNGTFVKNSVVTMQGAAIISNTNLTAEEIADIKIQPSIVVSDMQVKLIDGEIKPSLDKISNKITFELPEILKQGGNIFDIQNPLITLQVGNSMGITIDAGLTIIPYINGNPIQNGIVTTRFTVPRAAILGQSSLTNYWMSKSGIAVPEGYQSLVVPDLPNLMRVAADGITVNISPVITGNRQYVDLYSQKNQLDLKYSIHVPFDFGKDFNVLYLDTISNLNKDLNQFLKLTNQIVLIADIENSIPLNLDFEVVPMDSLNREITGISVSKPGLIKACNSDGSPIKSSINLVLKETVAGSLQEMDAILLKATATKDSTVAGMLLNANQSMTVKVRIKIPKGITITQN